MKKTLLGGVSSVTLSLIATAAFAFDGSGNTAGADNNIVTGGSTQTVVGDQSGNAVTWIDNSGNLAVDNTNAGNAGQISGGDSNTLSNNTVDISGNGSNNKSFSFEAELTNLSFDHSKNVNNSADFSDATGFVSGNVLNAQVAATHVDFDPDGLSLSGNSITSTGNSATGVIMGTQAGPNTTFSNTTNSVAINVGTFNAVQ